MIIKEGAPTIRYTCHRCGCVWEVNAKEVSYDSGVCPNCKAPCVPMRHGLIERQRSEVV